MKNKKTLVIGILGIVLISIAIFGSLYFTTDLFKTDQQLFYKYLSKTKILNEDFLKQYNIANNRITKNSNSSKTGISVSSSILNQETGIADVQEVFNISSNGLKNVLTKQSYRDFTISNSGQNLLTLKYMRDDNTYAISADNILTKYLAVENSNLKDLFSKIGVEDTTEIPNSIPTNYEEVLKIDEQTLNYLKETYGMLIYNNISKEKFYKTANEDNTATIGVSLSEQEVYNIIKLVLETAKNDNALLNLILNKLQLLNYNDVTIESIQTEIQILIDNLQIDNYTAGGVETISNSMEFNVKPLKIELVKKDKELIGLKLETMHIKKSMTYSATENMGEALNTEGNFLEAEEMKEKIEMDLSKENNLIIVFKENEVEQKSISINYSCDYSNIAFNIYVQDKNIGENIRNFPENIQIQYKINNFQTDNITQNCIVDINSNNEENYQVSINNNVTLKQDVIISKLTTENSAKLNNMTSEELNSLFTAIIARVMSLYGENIINM